MPFRGFGFGLLGPMCWEKPQLRDKLESNEHRQSTKPENLSFRKISLIDVIWHNSTVLCRPGAYKASTIRLFFVAMYLVSAPISPHNRGMPSNSLVNGADVKNGLLEDSQLRRTRSGACGTATWQRGSLLFSELCLGLQAREKPVH